LFTHDIKDFVLIARSWAAMGQDHAGLVYCHKESSQQAFDWIRRLFEVYSADELRNVTIGLPVD